jgi:hypothetical protein
MKKIIILLFVVMSYFFATAQIQHEFSIQGGGGLSTLIYKLPSGKNQLGGGGEFGVSYTCFFIKTVGIRIGVDIAFYNSKAQPDSITTIVTPNLTDSEGHRFNMHTTLSKYAEAQKAMFLNIPVMVQFQTKKFYAMGGLKIGIPVSCKFSVSDATLTNKGYYPEYDNWMTEPRFAGYGTFIEQNSEGKLPFQVSAALALETGVKWDIGKMFALYAGVYFDYGLNNIIKKGDHPFMNYSSSEPANFTTNSALPSITEKTNIMAFGVKMRFGFVK